MQKNIVEDVKKITCFATPYVGARVLNAANWFISMMIIARLGKYAVAAGVMMYSSVVMVQVIVWSMMYSMSVVVGKAYGASEFEKLSRIFRAGCLLAFVIGLPASFLLWNMQYFLLLFRQPVDLVIKITPYFHIMAFSILPSVFYVCFYKFSLGVGKSVLVFKSMLVAVLGNLILTYGFVLGKCGLPVCGIDGVAYANLIMYCGLCLGLFFCIIFSKDFRIFNVLGLKDSVRVESLNKKNKITGTPRPAQLILTTLFNPSKYRVFFLKVKKGTFFVTDFGKSKFRILLDILTKNRQEVQEVESVLYYFKKLFRIGYPISIEWGAMLFSYTFVTCMIGWLGENALAAHQVITQCVNLVIMVPYSVAHITAVLIAQTIGGGKKHSQKLLKRIIHISIYLSLTIVGSVSLLYWFAPRLLISAYLNLNIANNLPVILLATILLAIAGITQLSDTVGAIMTGALRGLHDTFYSMLISLLTNWGISVFVGYILAFRFYYGVFGIYSGCLIGSLISVVLLSCRWKNITSLM